MNAQNWAAIAAKVREVLVFLSSGVVSSSKGWRLFFLVLFTVIVNLLILLLGSNSVSSCRLLSCNLKN